MNTETRSEDNLENTDRTSSVSDLSDSTAATSGGGMTIQHPKLIINSPSEHSESSTSADDYIKDVTIVTKDEQPLTGLHLLPPPSLEHASRAYQTSKSWLTLWLKKLLHFLASLHIYIYI